MVTAADILGIGHSMLAAVHHPGDAVLEKLDPPVRAAVLMALLALTLVGLFLITFILVGGHWVRRPAPRQFGKNAATESGLPDVVDSALLDRKSSDTLLLDTSSKDTKVET